MRIIISGSRTFNNGDEFTSRIVGASNSTGFQRTLFPKARCQVPDLLRDWDTGISYRELGGDGDKL